MMNFLHSNSPHVNKILANKATLAVNDEDGKTVHFLVTSSKGQNYKTYCNEAILPTNPIATLKLYTEHTNDLYSHVNLSLASDSSSISEHADFIKELRASVLSKPLLDDGLFYRGVDLSKMEINEMEKLQQFFIPSFTSTSIDPSKAYSKNSMLHIKTSYMSSYACSITPELSNYHSGEQEVLIACYSAFRLQRVEHVNGKNVITLFLDDIASSNDCVAHNLL